MRVALITDGITPYVIGGMQKHSYYLAKYLAQAGVYVDLYHYNDSALDIDALAIFSAEEKAFITPYVLQFPVSRRFPGHYVYRSYLYSVQVFELLRNKLDQYDFIYTKGFTGWKLISEKKKNRIRCAPIGIKFHGYEMFQPAPNVKTKLQHYLLRPFVKKLSRQADVVFSYGGKITPIIRQLGVATQRIIELPSGVETSLICATPAEDHHPVRFVFLGRYERRKGIEEIYKALKTAHAEGKPMSMSFIGPIPDASKLHLEGITYYGEMRDPQAIQALLRQHDVLVCPSWSEGFPNVILEAMASGLAVIATDVGAVGKLVSSENGRLISPQQAGALLNAMRDLENTGSLPKLKLHSLSLVQREFNWTVIIQQLMHAIETLTTPS